ncbi:putative Methyltransferase, FkbM family [Candidatus Terasakiella magnetica]|nr:putative Methyltransferase, FkbM family [Candidatus Terasakiella magnetica]
MSLWRGLGRRRRQLGKAWRVLTQARLRRGLCWGVAATVEHQALLAGLAVSTVVDVGANRGQFALLARALWPQAFIHAYEPEAAAAMVFERLMAEEPRVRLTRIAVGAEAGCATLLVSECSDNSSLLPVTERQLHFGRGAGFSHGQEVSVARLDALLRPEDIIAPALLKLDIQGGELQALQGAGPLLARFAHILAEVSFVSLYQGQALAGDIVAFLHGQGFRLAGMGRAERDGAGVCVQTDFLFVRAV